MAGIATQPLLGQAPWTLIKKKPSSKFLKIAVHIVRLQLWRMLCVERREGVLTNWCKMSSFTFLELS